MNSAVYDIVFLTEMISKETKRKMELSSLHHNTSSDYKLYHLTIYAIYFFSQVILSIYHQFNQTTDGYFQKNFKSLK